MVFPSSKGGRMSCPSTANTQGLNIFIVDNKICQQTSGLNKYVYIVCNVYKDANKISCLLWNNNTNNFQSKHKVEKLNKKLTGKVLAVISMTSVVWFFCRSILEKVSGSFCHFNLDVSCMPFLVPVVLVTITEDGNLPLPFADQARVFFPNSSLRKAQNSQTNNGCCLLC